MWLTGNVTSMTLAPTKKKANGVCWVANNTIVI